MAQTNQTAGIECTEYTRTSDGVVMVKERESGLWFVRKGPRCWFWSVETKDWVFTGGRSAGSIFSNPGPFLMPFEEAYHLLETIHSING